MRHDIRQSGFLLDPVTRRPIQRRREASLAQVTNASTQLLLQRQRHEAFVATLAHELRQPLSTLFSAVEVLREAQGGPAVTKTLEMIQRQARHMSRLVEDVIEAARWARCTTALRTQRVDVRQQIAEALSDASAALSARGHELVVSNSADPLWVDADPARLRQVLSNLLDNAIKFTEPGGLIRIGASRAGMNVVLRVSDTGRGFQPHELTHIFELFSQMRPGEGRGLGIGLSVVREIVVLHGGRIEVRSDGPSRGSEFVVTLPMAGAVDSAAIERIAHLIA